MDADLYLLVYCVFLIGVSKAILDAAGPTVEKECTILGKDLSKCYKYISFNMGRACRWDAIPLPQIKSQRINVFHRYAFQ